MFTEINGLKYFYEDQGQGDAVILLHGFPLDHTMWRSQMGFFKERYRVIAPDLRGMGRTEVNRDVSSLDAMAQDVIQLMDALGLEKAVLAGFSMGGYIAFSLLRKVPERVRAVVLANTRPEADTPEGRINRLKMATNLLEQGTSAAKEAMVPKMLTAQTHESRPELVEFLDSMIDSMDPLGLVHASLAMAFRKDSSDELSRISVPVLVVAGDSDKISTVEIMKTMAVRIPGSRLVEITQAAHLTPVEQPEQFNRALEQFLQSIHK